MNAEFIKTSIPVLALVFSALSAWQANIAATEAKRKFESEYSLSTLNKGIELINSYVDDANDSKLDQGLRNSRTIAKCEMIVELGNLETDQVQQRRISKLFVRVIGQIPLPADRKGTNCGLKATESVVVSGTGAGAGASQTALGKHAAILASYKPPNCKIAMRDKERYEKDGVFGAGVIKVVRTSAGYFVVIADAGNDEKAARALVDKARALAPKYPAEDLANAFYGANKGWTPVAACP